MAIFNSYVKLPEGNYRYHNLSISFIPPFAIQSGAWCSTTQKCSFVAAAVSSWIPWREQNSPGDRHTDRQRERERERATNEWDTHRSTVWTLINKKLSWKTQPKNIWKHPITMLHMLKSSNMLKTSNCHMLHIPHGGPPHLPALAWSPATPPVAPGGGKRSLSWGPGTPGISRSWPPRRSSRCNCKPVIGKSSESHQHGRCFMMFQLQSITRPRSIVIKGIASPKWFQVIHVLLNDSWFTRRQNPDASVVNYEVAKKWGDALKWPCSDGQSWKTWCCTPW